MNIFLQQHQTFLFGLIDSNVEFILVGGYAVIYHGYGRTTGDMDLWLKPDNNNKLRLIDTLRAYGNRTKDKADVEELQKIMQLKKGKNL